MLARFDWEFHRKGRTRTASPATGFLSLITSTLSALLILWLGYHYLVQPEWMLSLPELITETIKLLEGAFVLTTGLLIVLAWIRQQEKSRKIKHVTIDDLYALSPAAFENFVAKLFRKKGYKVIMRGRSGDAGVDLEIYKNQGRRAIVQCKRYRSTIGPDIVRELFGTMIHEGVHRAFLVTTADISQSAREWAATKPITLIDGSALVKIASSLNKN